MRFDDLRQDTSYAWRSLRRQPGFAFGVIMALGLGIGANATMFGLLDRLLLKPPAHVVAPDRVVRLQITESYPGMGSVSNESMAYHSYTDQRDNGSWFSTIATYAVDSRMPLGRGPEAVNVRAVLATASYFTLLGVQPALGRFYTEAEDQPGTASPVAVLSWRYWDRAFGRRNDVLGRRMELGTGHYTVIGVAPQSFNGVDLNAVDLWIPLHAGASDEVGTSGEWRTSYGWQWLQVIGRLRDGTTRALASDEAERIQRASVAQVPEVDHQAGVALVPLRGFERAAVGHARERVALWLASVAAVVLLIVCANIANLLLARTTRRRREIAVRLALGVGRGRLARQMMTETLLLAAGGGLAGLLLARWGGALIRATLLPDTAWVGSPVDWRVVLVASLLALTTGILTGLAPAFRARSVGFTAALKSGNEAGSPRSRLRNTLLAFQASLSLLLLLGAGLFVKSLWRVVHTDLGYQTENVIVADADLRLAGYDRPGILAFYDQLLERARALPGVTNASLGLNSPFWTMNGTLFHLTDRDSTPMHPLGSPKYNAVTPDFFRTLGMRVIRGRGFSSSDREGTQPVMMVNQHLADFYWPGEDALGKCVKVSSDSLPCVTVVGMVANARNESIQEPPTPMYYLPLAQAGSRRLNQDRILFVRTAQDPQPVERALRGLLIEMAANLPAPNIRTLQSQIDPEIRPWRLGAVMFGVFGGLALLVAVIGLYSVMSYVVAQRTRELGIRHALGAAPGRIVAMVTREGVGVIAIGMTIGLLLALWLGRFLQPMLYETSARDIGLFLLVSAVLLAAALLAALVPALRATRVDPLEALRSE